MQVEQKLASGLTIRQDFRSSVRLVLFETGFDEWRYATQGGTAFIVNVGSKCFGITCRHAIADFEWHQLSLTDEKFGKSIAGVAAVYYPSLPEEAAIGSDILDLVVIEFGDDVSPTFFRDHAYIIDPNTVGTSRTGDVVLTNGILKDATNIDDEVIRPVFASLEFHNVGLKTSDFVLRSAEARFRNPEFETLKGMSGASVFNQTIGRLCGMVVRGNLTDGAAVIHYLDVADILEVVTAVQSGATLARYKKLVR
jgi:hypothetical protein